MTVSEWLWGLLIALLAIGVLIASLLWADANAEVRTGAGMVFARELWGVHLAKHDRPDEQLYVRPPHRALLRGTACIPLRELLLNRTIPVIHSYSRSVSCE